MDESDHLTLVNAGDEEVVSQEEGGREGSAAGGEGGGCCCASAIAIAHMRAHRARENSTRLGRVALHRIVTARSPLHFASAKCYYYDGAGNGPSVRSQLGEGCATEQSHRQYE